MSVVDLDLYLDLRIADSNLLDADLRIVDLDLDLRAVDSDLDTDLRIVDLDLDLDVSGFDTNLMMIMMCVLLGQQSFPRLSWYQVLPCESSSSCHCCTTVVIITTAIIIISSSSSRAD